MSLKIAMIGAGSIGFTRRLMHDVLSVSELSDTHFALTDLSPRNLEMVARLCERDIKANALPARLTASTDRRSAIRDADVVLCMIRQGGLEAFQTDIDIPLRYGVDQCVGDTLCAGGLMYAQRTIPVLLEFCRDIRELAKPGALLLNYSNPMAMNTWACNRYGGVRTIGLCHGVQGAHWQITQCIERLARRKKWIAPQETLHRNDVNVIAAGINHQTWFIKAEWRGMDFLPRLLELFEDHPTFSKTEKVRIDVLRRFGYYSTESNGHLSEYLPWYRKRPSEIRKWINLTTWINGETGGYLRVCKEGRSWFKTDYPNWLKDKPPEISPAQRSEEHASYILEALQTGRPYRGHINIPNQHHLTNLPNDAIIELPGYVDKTGIHVPVIGDLPLACAATCSASIRVQEMGMEAAVHGDVQLLKQAMLHDPLIGAVCSPEEVWQMTDDLLLAQARWLPQYQASLPSARKRLLTAVRTGSRVKLKSGAGAARLKTKSVADMKKDADQARANAAAADKGNMTRRRLSQ
ncbi:MAG: alpha-glucosidase/alpha-galactosidase [Blastochloris sp.]|nr:alpha-glucosidase/alpha-galactosidase [Blastochloris sp.]